MLPPDFSNQPTNKQYNPLYKNIELDKTLIDEFESESAKEAEKFENVLNEEAEENETITIISKDSDSDSSNSDLEEDPNQTVREEPNIDEKMFLGIRL